MIRVDNHSHIILADITDMVASAQAKDIRQYSITEHISQFRELKESGIIAAMHSTGRIFEDLNEYRTEFSRVDASQHPGMELRMGLEVDYLPQHEARIGGFVNQEEWDILLCSVHELKNRIESRPPGRGCRTLSRPGSSGTSTSGCSTWRSRAISYPSPCSPTRSGWLV